MSEFLAGTEGVWTGKNAFRLMPTDEPATAVLDAVVTRAVLQVHLAYTWHHPGDGEQRGLLALGRGEGDGALTALWTDTWHQRSAARVLHGVLVGGEGGDDDDGARLECTYAEGGWGWTIALERPGPDELVLRMENVVPASVVGGDEPLVYDAMLAVLRRG